jgi:outer membrane protein assembly factor BamB
VSRRAWCGIVASATSYAVLCQRALFCCLIIAEFMRSLSPTLIVVFAVFAAGTSCSGAAPADAQWGHAFVAPPQFEDGIPRLSSGIPTRSAFVEGEWRTHLGASHRSGLRDSPALEAPHAAWSARVGIQGYTNTPLIAANVVYVTSQGTTHNAPDAEDGFYALRKSDGQELWHTEIEEDVNGGVLTDTLVVGGGDTGMLYAVDRATGDLVWSRQFDTAHRHAPLERNGELWVSQRDGVHRVQLSTGAPIAVISSTTDAFDNRGGLAAFEDAVYRISGRSIVERLDDERVLWAAIPSAGFVNSEWGRASYGPPLALPGGALVQHDVNASNPTDFGRVAMYLDDGSLIWEFGQRANALEAGVPVGESNQGYDVAYNAGTPWMWRGVVWSNTLLSMRVLGARVEDGVNVAESAAVDCTTRAFASLVGVRDTLYRAHHNGHIIAFSTTTGEMLWQYDLSYHSNHGVRSFSESPAQVSYCMGEPYDGSGLFATPAVDEDGSLFVGSGEGWLYHLVER